MAKQVMPRHEFAWLVKELRDIPQVGCKRALIVKTLEKYGIVPEPVKKEEGK